MAVQVVSGTANTAMSFTQTATLGFNTSYGYPGVLPTSYNIQYVNTTAGALGVDTIHAKQYTLASTTVTIDLFGGTLLSPSGAACIFARVREFIVAPVSTTAGFKIQFQAGASSGVLWLPLAANPLFATPNLGCFRLSDPNSITTAGYLVDTSHKNITFDSGANTVIFNVLIVGNSSAS